MDKPFDNAKYIEIQKNAIKDRISCFKKLYIEVGGKLFDDNHASRVLPGFAPNTKMQILSELKNDLEVIFCINAKDIENKKTRNDNKLLYVDEVLRLVKVMQKENIDVLGIVITFYLDTPPIHEFENRCKNLNIKTFKSYFIKNYPNDIDKILSKDNFGRNDYIKTNKNLILVSAPGPGSGKLETCLSQLYNDKTHNISSNYAKYETFPVWNLPKHHLTNLAYIMATIDLKDKIMIDPFFKKTYKKIAINYNRDIAAFPILSNILTKINGKPIYFSPTEMGINCVRDGIIDDFEIQKASFEEIERRYNKNNQLFLNGKLSKKENKLNKNTYKLAKKIYNKLLKNHL